MDARVSVKDFEDAFTVEVPDVSEAEFDTLAGFVVAQVGRVLTQGETFAWKHLQMVVREADTTHIRSLEVHVELSSPKITRRVRDRAQDSQAASRELLPIDSTPLPNYRGPSNLIVHAEVRKGD